MDQWEIIAPRVNLEAEFWEIANDFGDPLEILREAISNAIDAEATWIRIHFFVEEIEGTRTLVIELTDNGKGMTYEVVAQDFWGLGYSRSRGDLEKIGEKGHGTKIYLRSERIIVRSQNENEAIESVCERPMRDLATRRSHRPQIRRIDKYQETTGSFIRIEDYNKSERSAFVQDKVRDYLGWFTKVGSIEKLFDVQKLSGFKVFLKCFDNAEEEIPFGHVFPEENSDIQKLFSTYDTDAGEWFCRRYIWNETLEELPDVRFQAVISVEGDRVKRSYNPMLRERIRGDSHKYKVADRYGIWLCKDFIPVQQVNEWISGFGTGSNSFVLLHGFVNCQTLKLTANRGSIANTDPKVTAELQKAVKRFIAEIDKDLHKNGLYTLLQWQSESRTLEQEKAEFDRRTKAIQKRKSAIFQDHLFLEPQNESELFGLLVSIYAMRPDIFEFEPLDYNTTRGIDIIARNKSANKVTDLEFWYVELKYFLKNSFNHAFKNLRWIVCWDIEKGIREDTEFKSIEETDVRHLRTHKEPNKPTTYFLDNPGKPHKIQVIRLSQFLRDKLGIEFKDYGVEKL